MTAAQNHQPQTAGTKASPEAHPNAPENNRGAAELALEALADALPAIFARFIEALIRLLAAWRAGAFIQAAPLPASSPRAPRVRLRAPRRALPRRRRARKAQTRAPRRTRACTVRPVPVDAARVPSQNPPRAFFSSA